MQIAPVLFLTIFIFFVKGQTTLPPNYSCNQSNRAVQFTLSNTYHSAWNPSLNCSLQQCSISSNNNSCLLSSTPCFDYRTLNNTRYCAPAIQCSVLLPCDNNTYSCTSNTSVCVINSCCSSQLVCLPLLVTDFCPSDTITTTSTSSSTPLPTYTSTATTVPLTNPCSSGIYWNVNGTTVAGTGSSGNASNELTYPWGIYLDSSDSLYISDLANHRVMKYLSGASSGTVVAGTTGVSGSSLNQLSYPTYVYVDSSHNLYVADGNNHRVMRWANGASSGSIVAGNGTLGSSLNQLYSPYGVWVDSSSNVFIAEFNNHRITKWSLGASSGVVVAGITTLAGYTPDRLAGPIGLYYDEINQDLYISNEGAYTIMRWHIGDANGTVIAGISGAPPSNTTVLNNPAGITLDQWKNLYVVDHANSRIQLFCSGNSTGITIAGTGTGGSGLLGLADVKLDSQMNLYVSEVSGYRITKFHKL